jgi:threonine/homoserine/homoserine lactone efflux protein
MSLDGIVLSFLAFAGAALLLAMVPGPSMAVIVRQTLRHGRGAGFAATLANEGGRAGRTGLLLTEVLRHPD